MILMNQVDVFLVTGIAVGSERAENGSDCWRCLLHLKNAEKWL
jgi:hypothetical protein